jgi:hypothetical protein
LSENGSRLDYTPATVKDGGESTLLVAFMDDYYYPSAALLYNKEDLHYFKGYGITPQPIWYAVEINKLKEVTIPYYHRLME